MDLNYDIIWSYPRIYFCFKHHFQKWGIEVVNSFEYFNCQISPLFNVQGCLTRFFNQSFIITFIIVLHNSKTKRLYLLDFTWGFTRTKMPNKGTIVELRIDEIVNYYLFFSMYFCKRLIAFNCKYDFLERTEICSSKFYLLSIVIQNSFTDFDVFIVDDVLNI